MARWSAAPFLNAAGFKAVRAANPAIGGIGRIHGCERWRNICCRSFSRIPARPSEVRSTERSEATPVGGEYSRRDGDRQASPSEKMSADVSPCLLYTSDAADDLLCVDL